MQHDMDDAVLALSTYWQSALLEHFQHRCVLRQDFGDQRLQPGDSRDSGQMPHQGPADALPLILVDDSKRDFGLPGLHEDVAPAADDILRASFRRDDDKSDLIDEVDVEEARR